jgi:hypothetical protein
MREAAAWGWPLTSATTAIRAVRFFADPGGSPTAIDARLRDIEMRAEEITGDIPKSEEATSSGWLWFAVAGAGALLFLAWQLYRRRYSD